MWRDLIKVHPAAELFPMMSDSELNELSADIKKNAGLNEGIVLWTPEKARPRAQPKELYLLDGRNRLEAAERWLADEEDLRENLLGIIFDTSGDRSSKILYGNTDPYAYVVSANIHRRHLSESQRAMVAAKIATMRQGEHQTGQLADLPTQPEAAALLNVSERSVRRARRVIDKGTPDLVAAVERGEVSVSAATNVVQHPATKKRRSSAQAVSARSASASDKRVGKAMAAVEALSDDERSIFDHWYQEFRDEPVFDRTDSAR